MIRVASVPACHPYVTAISDSDVVSLLPDPTPPNATEPGQWWPPRWLEPDYLRAHIHEIDVLHVHFGFDTTPTAVLTELCGILAEHDVPLIVTVHDLHNPHFADSTAHRARLGVLIAEAAAVITLTQGAARAIDKLWHRNTRVLPHPHLLPLTAIGAPRSQRHRPVVALHGKSLRANLDPWPVLDVLSSTEMAASLRLDLDTGALTSPRFPASLRDRLSHYTSRGVDVRIHQPFTDDELHEYLHEIDVLVLPYRFGTHSGWVELCRDAGVAAVVPQCGHFHEQHPMPVYGFDATHLDAHSLRTAVATALDDVRSRPNSAGHRHRRHRELQCRRVRREHVEIYRRALRAPRRFVEVAEG